MIQPFFNSDGTGVTVFITIIGSDGNHVDPDSWPITNDPAIVLSSHPSAAKTVTKVDDGVFKVVWSSLSPALTHGEIIYISIDGAISGTAWTTWVTPIQVVHLPAKVSDTQNIQSRLPAALNSGRMVSYVEDVATAAQDQIADAVASLNPSGKGADTLGGQIARTYTNSEEAEIIIGAIVQDTIDIQNRLPAALVNGRMDSYLGATANNVITHNTLSTNCIGNSQLATSAINVIQSGLATTAQLTTVEGKIDTIDTIADKLDTTVELDGAVYRFTENALEQAPTGGGGSGTGSFTISLTVKLSNGNTVGDCDVSLTTSSTSSTTNLVATGRTDPNGNVSFQLDSGVFYVWRQKLGVNFDDPAVLTVAGDGSATVS
jgi:hypothetical protein